MGRGRKKHPKEHAPPPSLCEAQQAAYIWTRKKRAMVALLSAAVTRTGADSPAYWFASDPMLCRFFFEEFVRPSPDFLVVCGGRNTTGVLATTSVLDLHSGTWSVAKRMPVPKKNHGLVTVGKEIFAVGGRDLSVLAFDVARRHWAELAPMEVKRRAAGVVAVGRRIFVMGGICDQSARVLDTYRVFNVAKRSWEAELEKMPTARCDFGTAVLGSLVYVLGGRGVAGPATTVDVLDTDTNTWSTLVTQLSLRAIDGSPAVAAFGTKIWMFGEQSTACLDVVEKKCTVTSSHQQSRRGAKAVVLEGRIFVVGGSVRGEPTNRVDICDIATGSWTEGPALRAPRDELAITGY